MRPGTEAGGTVPRIWLAHLPTAVPDAVLAATPLSAVELARAARFRFGRDRLRFTRARALLRHLLAELMDCPPSDVPLLAGQHGRPVVPAGPGGTETVFSVSHAGDWAIIGIAQNRRLGVDLELFRKVPELLPIAERSFTERETRLLQHAGPDERPVLFHTLWTRKEACLKAIGLGIPGGLDRFEVVPTGSESEASRGFDSVTARHGGNDTLWLGTLAPTPLFAASVAFDGGLTVPQVTLLVRAEDEMAGVGF